MRRVFSLFRRPAPLAKPLLPLLPSKSKEAAAGPSKRRWKLYTSWKEKVRLEEEDIKSCENFQSLSKCLTDIRLTRDHSLFKASEALKRAVLEENTMLFSAQMQDKIAEWILQYAPSLSEYSLLHADTNNEEARMKLETLFRLLNLLKYVRRMQLAMTEGEVAINTSSDSDSMMSTDSRLIDAFLLGSASERLSGALYFMKKSLLSFILFLSL